jgi:hypothetical protein
MDVRFWMNAEALKPRLRMPSLCVLMKLNSGAVKPVAPLNPVGFIEIQNEVRGPVDFP